MNRGCLSLKRKGRIVTRCNAWSMARSDVGKGTGSQVGRQLPSSEGDERYRIRSRWGSAVVLPRTPLSTG